MTAIGVTIQSDGHRLTVMRYVERNPVRANFTESAEDWPWGSAHARQQPVQNRRWLTIVGDPCLPRNWRSWVNKAETDSELDAVRSCVRRGTPFGDDRWMRSTVRLSLESTTRSRGRPKREKRDLTPFQLVPSTPDFGTETIMKWRPR